jgi:hypothetical protein
MDFADQSKQILKFFGMLFSLSSVTGRWIIRPKKGGRAIREYNTPTLCADTGAEG